MQNFLLYINIGNTQLAWFTLTSGRVTKQFEKSCFLSVGATKGVSFLSAKTWNQLSSDMKEANSLNPFKCKLKHHYQPAA